jgi:hypothetical protein
MSVLCKKLDYALELCKIEQQNKHAYPYLPVIVETLEKMKSVIINNSYDQEKRARMAGGLGRIITEDYSFSVSELGIMLLGITDEFVTANVAQKS